ncbi:uncharacterized protein UHO2_06777 [Ustilago hordei]|uniref:CCHC-type domain-containing protein n=1 Tax=Ustilago hordei TaxID=120017 RepID=I2FZ43_USTHO|nr:uncharacterized protein UHO2_06777 [Ustilago hordei]KAJ1577008.1 hypothetical protein NDA15_005114 [Ustilago hordei]KAJ1578635.1 hypothetical protein NDA12_003544 [Ustilago hordei]CCF52186.1 uncharacterized protein UHOR_08473 [Ustilago hordei]SYW83563.1 uncharacterized protein UHO2_06777 [Ustilago hordei]
MSEIDYLTYDNFVDSMQDLLPHLPMIVQNCFNWVMTNEVYGMPNAPKTSRLLKYVMDDDDKEQVVSPLSIMIECIGILYKAMHNLGPFANQTKLGRAMQTRVTLFLVNEEWDVTHILDLKIEGLIKHACLPIKVESPMLGQSNTLAFKMSNSNRCLNGHEATPCPTPELSAITNHHLKVLSGLNNKMKWEEQDLLDPSFSNKLHTEYFAEHGNQPMLIAVDLFEWAINKCTVHSTAKEYELLTATYDLHWDQVGSRAYDFLTKWEAHVSKLHAYLKVPWTPDHHYWTLKHALPSDRNVLFNSVSVLHEKLHGKEQTAESVANILCECYELAAKSTPVHLPPMTEALELITLHAAMLINCWACGELSHTANHCPDNATHAKWKQGKIKMSPKGHANACVILPLKDTQED